MQDTLLIPEYSAEKLSEMDFSEAARISEELISAEAEKAAGRIYSSEEVKIVLLSGPSASGKTSVAKLICKKITALGKKAFHISLDDFFLGTSFLPILPDGTYDMESIAGLDTEFANACFARLLETGKAELPTFDFPAQRRSDIINPIDLGENGIILVEGIHSLSPMLTENLPSEKVLRAYISPKIHFTAGGKTVFSPEDIRLARRLIRDELFRNWSAEKTFAQWKSVIEGEKKYIDPYKDSAELNLNSALFYEPAALKKTAEEFLGRIPESSDFYAAAQSFMQKYRDFPEIGRNYIPENSIIHEFIG